MSCKIVMYRPTYRETQRVRRIYIYIFGVKKNKTHVYSCMDEWMVELMTIQTERHTVNGTYR
jgi:hypothetical protein